MPISVLGFASSTKTPGIYISTVLGGPGTSAGAAPNRVLVIDQMLTANVTGASPAFTVPAGTATVNQPVQVFSPADGRTKAGAGSPAALACAAAFEQDPSATVWLLPLGAGTGTATGAITMTGTPTAAYTIRVWVCGRFVDVAVASGDSVTAIATAIATAINQQTDWPCTAQFASGVVTLTAKVVGLVGSRITFRAQQIYGAATVDAKAGALAATTVGSTLTLSGGTVQGNTYRLTGGTTAPALATALANVASTRFHRIALGQDDATSLAAVQAQVTTMAGVGQMLWQQWIAASSDSYATAVALATARNDALGQIAWHFAADRLPGEIAAQLAAGRLAGDGVVGGAIIGESTDPATNLDGLQLATVPAQTAIADQPLPTQIEAALNNGLTPLVPKGTTGLVTVARSITTRFLDATSNPNYAVIDTEYVTVTHAEGDSLRALLASQLAGAKLGDDAADGSLPQIAGVTTASLVRGMILTQLKTDEQRGRLTQVDAKASLLVVAKDAGTPGRLLAEVPIVPIPNLHQVGVNLRQLNAA
jgi:phage tail sheath gpL-like